MNLEEKLKQNADEISKIMDLVHNFEEIIKGHKQDISILRAKARQIEKLIKKANEI
jgi:hypothetical protein